MKTLVELVMYYACEDSLIFVAGCVAIFIGLLFCGGRGCSVDPYEETIFTIPAFTLMVMGVSALIFCFTSAVITQGCSAELSTFQLVLASGATILFIGWIVMCLIGSIGAMCGLYKDIDIY